MEFGDLVLPSAGPIISGLYGLPLLIIGQRRIESIRFDDWSE
jgi:hypothetical protein